MNNNHTHYLDASIIILTYNGSKYMKPLLESLMDQSYPENRVEIIVVDNASTDDTKEIIENSFPFVKFVPLKRNMGFAAGNNQGFLHASHDLLVFLNQDTICHPDFLKSLVAAIAADKSIAACNPNIITTDQAKIESFGKNESQKSLFVCDLSPFGYGRNRKVNGKAIYYTKLLSGCAFIIRRETVAKLGYLFDDHFWMYAEDTDLSLRIHNIAHNICVTRDAIVYHLHKSNTDLEKGRIITAAGAIQNRVFAFYKNMSGLEFFFFFPLLFFGGIFKIFAFPLTGSRKAIYFLPFGLFSMACMLAALFQLPRFEAKKRRIMEQREIPNFALLKLILKR
jgi:GT2 family glycosyltransferase